MTQKTKFAAILTILFISVGLFYSSNQTKADYCVTGYCCQQSLVPGSAWISNVKFNTINNNSGASSDTACLNSDYTSAPTTVQIGNSYDLSVTVKQFEDDILNQCVRISFGWLALGNYESFDLGCSTQNTAIFTKRITVPHGKIVGQAQTGAAIMRVTLSQNNYIGPCIASCIWGEEVENYKVNVKGTLPVVETGSVSHLESTSATLGGNVSDYGGASSLEVWLQYGVNTSYGKETARVPEFTRCSYTPCGFGLDASGLLPGTTYHFRAAAKNTEGTAYGADKTFTTTGTNAAPPSLITNAASNIQSNQTTLNGNLADLGGASSATVWFQWGAETGGLSYGTGYYTNLYGSGTTANLHTGTYCNPATGICSAPISSGYWVAKWVCDGNQTNCQQLSTEQWSSTSFRVDEPNPGAGKTVQIDVFPIKCRIGESGWDCYSDDWNNRAKPRELDYVVWYSGDSSVPSGIIYTNETTHVTKNSPVDFAANIPGLSPNTTYHFRAAGENTNGISYGSDRALTTLGTGETGTGIGGANVEQLREMIVELQTQIMTLLQRLIELLTQQLSGH